MDTPPHPLAISSGVDRPAVLDYSKKQLLAEGRSMKEVASILQITKRTVAAHKDAPASAWNLFYYPQYSLFVRESAVV
jgi:Bacterial regulatory proteins, luxR family